MLVLYVKQALLVGYKYLFTAFVQYPYAWVSPMAQVRMNLPMMQET